jgi:hypothetical protein
MKWAQRSFLSECSVGARQDLFEPLHAAGGEQGPHLSDGDVVEGGESFGLWQALADEDGVQAFEVGEDGKCRVSSDQ